MLAMGTSRGSQARPKSERPSLLLKVNDKGSSLEVDEGSSDIIFIAPEIDNTPKLKARMNLLTF